MDFEVAVKVTQDNLLPSDMTLENSVIRVLVIKDGLAKPLIASTVVMPQPELQVLIG
jgi:Bardet-Biedl syndrome 1 protein